VLHAHDVLGTPTPVSDSAVRSRDCERAGIARFGREVMKPPAAFRACGVAGKLEDVMQIEESLQCIEACLEPLTASLRVRFHASPRAEERGALRRPRESSKNVPRSRCKASNHFRVDLIAHTFDVDANRV